MKIIYENINKIFNFIDITDRSVLYNEGENVKKVYIYEIEPITFLNFSIDVQSKDRYGRYLAYVYSPEGKDVSLLMIHEGMAWHFTKYDNNEVYEAAQMVAKKAKRGLWADPSPIAPWEFRPNKGK